MSDYRRFVSYIYLYENNVKSLNAGFVKVESRNGQCRLSLSLKNVYSVERDCKVYLFMRMGQELCGIYIGKVQIHNHGSDWNFRTETQNIAGSGYSLDQMSGMIIQGEGNKFYGTRWDQGDLDIHRFVTDWSVSESEQITGEEMHKKASEKMLEEKVLEIVEDNQIDKVIENVEAEPCDNIEKDASAMSGCNEQKDQKFSEIATVQMNSEDIRRQNFAKILEQCPGMYPFEDDVIEACVRLEPQDIGMMPLDCWAYGNNSFLLHGYYSYRHLILARMKSKENESKSYILGVPGTQHSRDAFMANMFGFRDFKPIREDVESPGNFGYWYTVL